MKQLIPEMVLDDGLLQAMAAIFGMDALHGGAGVRRDERGWIVRDDHGRAVSQPVARSLWVAEIRPAHMDPACLGVVTIEERRMAGFVIETHPWVAEYPPHIMPIVPPTLVCGGPVQLDAAWDDPVVAALGRLEEWPRDDGVTLDGRSYALFMGTSHSQLALQFSNPRVPALMALEDSLMQVARLLIAHDRTGVLAPYVEQWSVIK